MQATEYVAEIISRGSREIDNGNYDRAIVIFRQGMKVAPLHGGLRELLAEALDLRASFGDISMAKTKAPAPDPDMDEIDPVGDEEEDVEKHDLSESANAGFSHKSIQRKKTVAPRRRARVKLPTWLITLAVLGCLFCVSVLLMFSQNPKIFDDMFSWFQNIGASPEVVAANKLYDAAIVKIDGMDNNAAIPFLKQAIETHPDDDVKEQYRHKLAEVFYNLGDKNYDDKKNDSALENLKKSVEYNPKHAQTYFMLGFVYHQKAQKLRLNSRTGNSSAKKSAAAKLDKQAVGVLKKAIEIDEKHYRSMYLLSDIYPKLTNLKDGQEIWWRIIETAPDKTQIKKAKNNLSMFSLPPKRPKSN